MNPKSLVRISVVSLFLGFPVACTKTDILPSDSQKILNQTSSPLTHLDPQLTTGLASSMQLAKAYESLLETHPFDSPYQVIPNLAEAMPAISNNGLTYIFKIRKINFYW